LDTLYKAGLLNNLAGIVGTSVGGLNACALAAGLYSARGTAVLAEAWGRITQDTDVYTPSATEILERPLAHIADAVGCVRSLFTTPSAFSSEPLQGLVSEVFGDLTTEEIEKVTGIKLRVRACKAKSVDTLYGRLKDMALCTSAIEGVFPPHLGYSDGGAVDNAPIGYALDQGAEQVIVVYCGPEDSSKPTEDVRVGPETPVPSTDTGIKLLLDYLQGVVERGESDADREAQDARERGVEIIDCYPPEQTGSSLDFRPRGLWERGQAEGNQAVLVAQNLGWL
jgi:predicted acylesterase/phospholipase RssA